MRCASRSPIMAAQGSDVKLDPARVAGYRNFGTKLWNATRFAEMNGVARNDGFWLGRRAAHGQPLDPDRARRGRRARSPTASTSYRFNEAAGAAYRFVWNLFCDWYLELLKPVFAGDRRGGRRPRARRSRAYVLDEIYKLLHPFMPFMTEELWAHTAAEGERAHDAALPCRMAGAGLRGCRSGRRDQLADRPGLRHPLGPRSR